MNHDVFISYSSKNKNTALAVCHVLEQHRIKCWMAPRDIPPGADYGDVIDEAILACRVFVIIFSEPASVSPWVKGELNLAFTEAKYIVPYRIDQTALKGAMRVMMNQMHWVEAYPDAESKFDELVAGIARYLNIPQTPPPTLSSSPTPPPPARTYKVGDLYNENGKTGVVFETDATGRHGKIVSLRQSPGELPWCTYLVATGADDKTDGRKNMQAIMRLDGWREKYPAFAWCAAQGAGWYLPAIEELRRFTLDAAVRDAVDLTLSRQGGDMLPFRNASEWCIEEGDRAEYWSSSEMNARRAWYVCLYSNPSSFEPDKNRRYYVRAVSAF